MAPDTESARSANNFRVTPWGTQAQTAHMRRLGIALTLLALAANALAGDGVYFWRIRRGDSGERTSLRSPPIRERTHRARSCSSPKSPERTARPSCAERTSPALLAAPSLKRSATVVLRLNRHGGDFATDSAWNAAIIGEFLRAKDALQNAGAAVDEAQLDFDCPVSRLRDYAAFLRDIKPRCHDLRLTVTGMPAWLDSQDLPELLAATDGWTLQVHLTDLPRNPDMLPPLCDTGRARTWAARASALGKPFRIALPTYSYRAHFDASGKFLGVESESGKRPPASASTRIWEPDTRKLAALVNSWRAAPLLANFTGVDWYRLPCDDDRLNLAPAAFAKLLQGEAPAPGKIELRLTRFAGDRLADFAAVNTGELDADLPGKICADFGPLKPLAYDLPGSRRLRESDTELVFAPPATRLRPGESRPLGWFRFEQPATSISLKTVSP